MQNQKDAPPRIRISNSYGINSKLYFQNVSVSAVASNFLRPYATDWKLRLQTFDYAASVT